LAFRTARGRADVEQANCWDDSGRARHYSPSRSVAFDQTVNAEVFVAGIEPGPVAQADMPLPQDGAVDRRVEVLVKELAVDHQEDCRPPLLSGC